MIPLNYHHLYYFWVTAKAGSITKAGEELLLAQPTLSLQLKQLEKSLGKTLLQRRRDGICLTTDGQRTFEYCEKIFTQGDALLRSLREGQPAAAPVLRIGLATSVSRGVALKTLEAMADKAPAVRATIFSASEHELQSRLARQALDLVLAPFDISNALGKDFRGRLVAEIPVSFVTSPRLKKALGPFPTRGSELPMLLRNPENPLRKDIEDFLTRRGVRYRIVTETEDGYLLRVLAAEGRGVAALNELACENNLKEDALVRLNKEPTGLKDSVWFVARVQPNAEPGLHDILGILMSGFKLNGAVSPRS